MKRNLILAGITLLLLGLGIAGCLMVLHASRGTIAVVRQDGKEIHCIDLSKVKESYTISVTNAQGGENIILVEPGAISMQSADCPDGLCMQMGVISRSGLPIVCLPNHVIIEIEGGTSDGPDVQVY